MDRVIQCRYFRGIPKLALDAKIMEKSGRALKVTDLAEEYGLTDVKDAAAQ